MRINNPSKYFKSQLSSIEKKAFDELYSPAHIQEFLDQIPYSPEEANRSPLQVIRDREAHCLDGGLFAAAVLRHLGYPPLILDLQPEPGMDDDHVLALYKIDGYWGAVAKSNYNGLRYREPIYRTLRELALSYFEDYFNLYGEKTLRCYTRPINLARFDRLGWMWSHSGADAIEMYLEQVKLLPLISAAQASRLNPMEKLSYLAGRMGINETGVYQPKFRPKKK